MAKKSKKKRHEKDQAGCMWSLLNIFDFRQVRASQKLLLDKKRGSKRLDGTVLANITLESLSDSCRISIDGKDLVENETATIDTKLSVKELMEEEMCGEQDGEQQGSIGDEDTKQKKNRRWRRSKMSLDLDADGFIVDGDLVGNPKHRKHKSCSGVELNEMVEELCSRIHQKDIGNLKHIEDGKFNIKRIQDSSAVEKKLSEAAKVLVNHFTDGKSGTKERKIQPTKELTDALQMLNSNKEKFLKLLQDPNSQLVKHIQSLQDIQIEEGKFNVLAGSDLLEQDISNAKQPNYFWRRFNSQEKNSSKKSDSSVDLSRVVVLKPGPPSSKNSDIASTCSSLPESPKSMKEKDEIQKSSSPFTFAEFKRKIKFAMRKEHRDLLHQFSEMQPNIVNRDKKVSLETTTMASPSRDHFLVDRIPKSSATFRKVDNIYIEAKRHLAEIVGNTDVDVDTHGRKVPKSLGRILSYSGYNSPTISSPRTDADVRLSDAECQTVDTKTSSDKPICDEEVPATEPIISDGVPAKCSVDKSVQESEVPSSEDIVTGIGSASQKESNLVDIVNPEQFDCHTRICYQENSLSSTSEQSTSEENEHSSFQDSSTLNCSLCGKMEDIDAMSDATSRPSPISVLEPIFKEDEISPPGIKHFTAVEPIHPRQIKFEEEIAIPIARIPSDRTCINYDKYTFEFVKDVVQMSGLTWTELLRRSLFSDDLINPSLIDEVDFLPDLLPCDFNLLFDLINEVVVELCWLNYGCMLSLATPFVDPSSKGKHISGEVWRKVNWYLKLEVPLRTLDRIIGKDFAKQGLWADLQLDSENIGIEIQEAILDELVEETISCFVCKNLHSEISILPVEDEGQIIG